ncbi:MAG TPA: GNAT family N-acetyltransferase [Tepidiformaceae bacterium]|jgi:predicted GNAT family acetyltransferase|nr:GNAT family N-acetyltransferase [Tepidiformaceae bacterium]
MSTDASESNLVVHQNEQKSRFEIDAGGKVAELVYRLEPGVIDFLHTGVPKELEGRGIAGRLAAAGLDYAREHGLRVIATCPYVKSYIERHAEYQDLVRS